MNKRHLLILLGLLLCFSLWGARPEKTEHVLKGRITDRSGFGIPYADVVIININPVIGVNTDNGGYFSFRVPSHQDLILRVSHLAYRSLYDTLTSLQADKTWNAVLFQQTTELSTATVRSRKAQSNIHIDARLTAHLPSVGGASVEGLIKTLPGVSSNNELSNQFSVRGGNYDENLVYVNNFEIFRPQLVRSGEREGLSFINPDLVESIQFSSGGFDAKYGDKMSSVLDVKYKRPNKFAGSLALDLLGGSAHLEGSSRDQKFTFLLGGRQKSNQYILKTLDNKGDYKPSYTDLQAYMEYRFTPQWELSFLGNYARNVFRMTPSTRQSSVSNNTTGVSRLMVFFDGAEHDKQDVYFMGVSLRYIPSQNINHRFSISGYQSIETESFDIAGSYWLKEALSGSESWEETDRNGTLLGAGSFLNHARNYLNTDVFNINYRAEFLSGFGFWTWGAQYQFEGVHDQMSEWNMIDSAGYSIPLIPGTPGQEQDPQTPSLQDVYRANNRIQTHRIKAFVQNNINLGENYSMTAGVRMSYWNYNNEFTISPRVSFGYHPIAHPNIAFRLATGLYYQPPFYKEMRWRDGTLNKHIRSQGSWHTVLGSDWWFEMWNRSFKFTAEAYYKHLFNLIPYEVDNLRIRYHGDNIGKGFAAGLDLRLHGEIVEGIESWAGISVMRTRERLNGGPSVPRPTDQLFSFNFFLQDYLIANNNLKLRLNMVFGTGLPYGIPGALDDIEQFSKREEFRMRAYFRTDVGLSYRFSFIPKVNFWIDVEAFNLFSMQNTISYLWIQDVSGGSFGLPNYLTPRLINFKIRFEF